MGATIQGFHTHKPCDGCSVGYYQSGYHRFPKRWSAYAGGRRDAPLHHTYRWFLSRKLSVDMAVEQSPLGCNGFLEIMFANGLNLLYITFISILDNVDLLWGSFFPTVAMALLAIFITPTCYYFMRQSYKKTGSWQTMCWTRMPKTITVRSKDTE